MGDLQAWPQPNGNLTEEKESSSSANPNPSSIDGKLWALLEERASEIILCVHPTVKSERRRNDVIDYVQRLIQGRIDCKVFPFGSVPLKTYLPDGDVDLTAFSNSLNIEDKWANDVRAILQGEETSEAAEFRVREVHYIKAEVKLVKCLVENIVVDISFNQLGGLSTLCFLEKVDRLIGKDHLFKRSIILVKAWCYYESRLLGAHHALISTYALETLVLYIFNRFHASLHGPLEVLYRFLDYFSKFDWENYCVSLQGPVSISALPVIVAEPPETDGAELLLNEEFLKSCSDLYSVLPKTHDNQNRSLTPKSLNIIDPLRENNNLGRSVSKGNFFRIRSAFGYGARMLGKVLLASEENIPEELDKFFQNTLLRHGKGQRPDVPDLTVYSPQSRPVGENTIFLQSLKSDAEHKRIDNNVLTQQIKTGERDGHSTESSEIAGFVPDVVYASRQFVGNETGQGMQSSCLCSTLSNCSPRINNELASTENLVSGSWMSGDVKDLVTNHSDCGCFRSKSPCVLPENGISRHCCYCKSSENMENKAVTVSFSEDSKLFSSHCQGHLSSKDARNGANHGGTLNSCMDCSCEHYDCQSASCIEKLSIDAAAIQQGCTVANPRYMMPNTSQRDILSSHVQNSKSLVQFTRPELFLPSPVASVSVSYPSLPVGHLEPMNVHLQNASAFLHVSSLHLGEVVHDSTLLEPGIGGNSLDNGPSENGNIEEGEIPLLVLKPNLSSLVTESSKQAKCSEESLIGNGQVDRDNLDCVNDGNSLAMIHRDSVAGCHVLYPDKKDEVCQCPEHLLQQSMDSDSRNSNITTQASASPLPSFGFKLPAYPVYSHPMQEDYQKTSLEKSPSTSGKLSQCSLSSNLSDISRLSNNTTLKSASVLFSFDGTQPSLESGYLFNKPQESLKDWQGGKGDLSGPQMQRIAVDALRCQKPDLTADFDSHLNNLNFGKWCLESGMQSPVLQQPMMPPYMKEKYIPDGFVRPFPANANMFPYIPGGYGVGRVSPFFHAYRGPNTVILPGKFPVEDMPKPRSGTGTYFPNTSISPYKERPSNRGRYQGASAQDFPPRVSSQMNRFRSNGRNKTTFDQPLHRQIGNKSSDVNSVGVRYGDSEGDVSNSYRSFYQAASSTVLNPLLEAVSHDVYPSSKMTGHGKVSISPKAKHSNPSVSLMRSHSNGSGFSPEQVEFGTFGPVQLGAVSPAVKSDESRHMDSDQLNGQLLGSGSEVANTSNERITQKPAALSNNGREASSSSLLKEDDFPPLPFQRQHGTSSGNARSNGNSNNKVSHWQTFVTTS